MPYHTSKEKHPRFSTSHPRDKTRGLTHRGILKSETMPQQASVSELQRRSYSGELKSLRLNVGFSTILFLPYFWGEASLVELIGLVISFIIMCVYVRRHFDTKERKKNERMEDLEKRIYQLEKRLEELEN